MRCVLRGDIDAFAANTWTGEYFLRELGIRGIKLLPAPFATLEGGMALRPEEAALLADIDRAVTHLKDDGTFDQIIDRWAGQRVHVFSRQDLLLIGVAALGSLITISFAVLLLMAYHDKIFEIFRRLHTYNEYGGSGVGLALVKRAAERMGGRVWAESEPGKGATFFLELQSITTAAVPDVASSKIFHSFMREQLDEETLTPLRDHPYQGLNFRRLFMNHFLDAATLLSAYPSLHTLEIT